MVMDSIPATKIQGGGTEAETGNNIVQPGGGRGGRGQIRREEKKTKKKGSQAIDPFATGKVAPSSAL